MSDSLADPQSVHKRFSVIGTEVRGTLPWSVDRWGAVLPGLCSRSIGAGGVGSGESGRISPIVDWGLEPGRTDRGPESPPDVARRFAVDRCM